MKLKFLLVKAYKLIEIQKSTINELTTQLNNSNQNLNIYKEKIRQQELQRNNLYQQVKNPNTNTKVYKNEMMCVNFISANQQIHYAVPCVKNDTFASVEEKLYQRFPQYREKIIISWQMEIRLRGLKQLEKIILVMVYQ